MRAADVAVTLAARGTWAAALHAAGGTALVWLGDRHGVGHTGELAWAGMGGGAAATAGLLLLAALAPPSVGRRGARLLAEGSPLVDVAAGCAAAALCAAWYQPGRLGGLRCAGASAMGLLVGATVLPAVALWVRCLR